MHWACRAPQPDQKPLLVVGQDEREAGLRAILNFGHTFGHAIEAWAGYGAGCTGKRWVRHGHGRRLSCAWGWWMARLSSGCQLPDRAGRWSVIAPRLDVHDNAARYLNACVVDKKATLVRSGIRRYRRPRR